MTTTTEGNVTTVWLTPLDCYSAMVAMVDRGDRPNAVRYARLLLSAKNPFIRRSWLANATAVVAAWGSEPIRAPQGATQPERD